MCGAGKGLNQFHLLETSPSVLVQLKIQICVRCVMGSFTSSVTHHSETHIIINVVMKGFKWLNVNLNYKPNHDGRDHRHKFSGAHHLKTIEEGAVI